MNNFYLFIRKYFEHASLQHLRIPVHLDICARLLGKAVEVSWAKLLLMQLEVRGKGNPGMPWGDCCSTAYSLFCGLCTGLCGSHCAGYVIEKKSPQKEFGFVFCFGSWVWGCRSRTRLWVRQAEPSKSFHCSWHTCTKKIALDWAQGQQLQHKIVLEVLVK